MAHYEVRLEVEINAEPEVLIAAKTSRDLLDVKNTITEFIGAFGIPDHGEQTIRITIRSKPD